MARNVPKSAPAPATSQGSKRMASRMRAMRGVGSIFDGDARRLDRHAERRNRVFGRASEVEELVAPSTPAIRSARAPAVAGASGNHPKPRTLISPEQ